MKTKLLALFLAFSISNASAQGGGGSHGGGGNVTEANLKYMITRITEYLSSKEGRESFKEIADYNSTHAESFESLALRINPSLIPATTPEEELPQVLKERDCYSDWSVETERYFICKQSALPDYSLQNQPTLYRIVFHELLVHAGLEKPMNSVVKSVYPIAGRMNFYTKTYQEVLPGTRSSHNSGDTKLVTSAKMLISESSAQDPWWTGIHEVPGYYGRTSMKTAKLSWMPCKGEYLDFSVQDDVELIKWEPLPSPISSLSLSYFGKNHLSIESIASLPYIRGATPQLINLEESSILTHKEGSFQFTLKGTKDDLIVVEVAVDQNHIYFNRFKSVTGTSPINDDLVPFVYLICKTKSL